MLDRKKKSRNPIANSRTSSPNVINKRVPPYREIRLFPKLKLIMTDFDFHSYLSDNFGDVINKKLSNIRYIDFEDLALKGDEKGWQIYDINYTHALESWQVDNRLLVFCRALINGHEYTIAQWQNSFIFIRDSEAFTAIFKEGTLDPIKFIKNMH